jgi:hypothetical protein
MPAGLGQGNPGFYAIDSIWLHVGRVQIPTAFIWDLLGSLFIALLVYLFASRQFRLNKWWERRLEKYIKLDEELLILKRMTDNLGTQESNENWGLPVSFTPQEIEEFRRQAARIDALVRDEVDRPSLMLSTRALGLLEGYVKNRDAIYELNTTSPVAAWATYAGQLFGNFHDLTKVDLGTAWAFLWWIRRGWRGLRFWVLRRRGYFQSKWWLWRWKRLDWKPSAELDDKVREWLRSNGWDPTSERYDRNRKLYFWFHSTSAGGSSALIISRKMLEGRTAPEVLSYLNALKVAQAKQTNPGRLLIVMQRGEEVTVEDW